jgi:spore coat protein U-like protein
MMTYVPKIALRGAAQGSKVGRARRAALQIGLLSLLVSYAPARPTEAATVSTTFLVTANITVNCLISATQLAFGPYQPRAANATAPLNGQSQITVTCTNGGTWVVGLDQGQFPSATVTTRQMTGLGTASGSSLQYSLFSDAARTINWGNTVGVDTVSGVGSGGPQIVIVYGQVPAGQTSAIAGGYQDTITATITF